ncbi:MAG: hypothetical protein EOO51_07945 [Flavobacterium sp.]|nr:MAG: hypothetical protein EOO51_07945 [Flavobacterium sp.]
MHFLRTTILPLALSFVFFIGCKPADTTRHEKDKRIENKAVVLKLYQAINDKNWTAARSFVGDNYKHYYVKGPGFESTSWSGFEQGYKSSEKAFPDWQLSPVKVIAEGDFVSVLLTGAGTHTGDFAGIAATNKKVAMQMMIIHEVRNGKIIADWEMSNPQSFINQLKP